MCESSVVGSLRTRRFHVQTLHAETCIFEIAYERRWYNAFALCRAYKGINIYSYG